MITPREDLLEIVETPQFRRALRRYPGESVEGRVLKGLERLARGTTKKDERARRARTETMTTASAHALRQSEQKEQTGHGVSQRISA